MLKNGGIMAEGINLRINNFKGAIAKCINDAMLPPGIVQMVLEGTLREVTALNINAIAQEQAELEKEGVKDGKEVHKA